MCRAESLHVSYNNNILTNVAVFLHLGQQATFTPDQIETMHVILQDAKDTSQLGLQILVRALPHLEKVLCFLFLLLECQCEEQEV